MSAYIVPTERPQRETLQNRSNLSQRCEVVGWTLAPRKPVEDTAFRRPANISCNSHPTGRGAGPFRSQKDEHRFPIPEPTNSALKPKESEPTCRAVTKQKHMILTQDRYQRSATIGKCLCSGQNRLPTPPEVARDATWQSDICSSLYDAKRTSLSLST